MSKPIIFILILLVSAGLVGAEYLLHPPKVVKIEATKKKAEDSETMFTIENPETNRDTYLKYIKKGVESPFFKAGIKDISLKSLARSNSLFSRVKIEEKDDFYLVTATFEKEGQEYIKIIEFQTDYSTTSTRIITIIKEKLEKAMYPEENIKENIKTFDSVSDYAFYFNNKNFPKTSFLIVKSGEKIIAFEYAKTENGNTPEDIKLVIKAIFQKE